jgi:hypothetical protein
VEVSVHISRNGRDPDENLALVGFAVKPLSHRKAALADATRF